MIVCPGRVLIVTQYFCEGNGGTPEAARLLACQMAEIGIICDVVCTQGFVPAAHQLDGLPADKESEVFRPRQQVSVTNYNAVFVTGSWNMIAFYYGIRAFAAAVPLTYAAKGNLCRIDFERWRDFKKVIYLILVEGFLVTFSDRIIFSSRAERDNFVVPQFLWGKKCVVLPEPFRGPPLRPGLSIDARNRDIITLGFLAEISARKGLRELVEGFVLFRSQNPALKVRLLVGGTARPGSEGYLEKIREYLKRGGCADHVIWCGVVRKEDRQAFYENLDLFVCPSRFESFGLTPLEALWYGIPVVIGRQIGVYEFLPADAPVYVLESLRAEFIANVLSSLVPELAQIGKRARRFRGKSFPALSGSAHAQLFESVLFKARHSIGQNAEPSVP
jgi:glycosyltransferase involved in cell wall biosynthesis